jgi:predicted PurR-regulated permease PerM
MAGSNRADDGRIVGLAARVTLVVLGILVGAWLLFELRAILLLLALAVVLASAVLAPEEWIEQRGAPRVVAVVAVYLAVLAVLVVMGLFIVPPFVEQAASLAANLPTLADRARTLITDAIAPIAGSGASGRILDVLGQLAANPPVGSLVQLPITVAGALVNIALVAVISGMIVLERDAIRTWSLRFVERPHQAKVVAFVDQAVDKLGGYARGQLVVMTFTGVGSFIGMILLGVPFAVPLGLLAFLTELIPFVGPYLAGVPIVVIAALEDPFTGLLIAVWLIGLQQLEGLVVIPLVQGRILSLSPLVVLIAVLVGGSLAGLIGALLAVPAVAVIDVLVREVILPLRHGREPEPDVSPERDAAA